MKLNTEIINNILGINEAFKAPTRVMDILWNRTEREHVFRKMLDIESDVSTDWFHTYFEEEQADRKVHKQDFTPDSISDLLALLTAGSDGRAGVSAYDPTAGTGGLIIRKWWMQCSEVSPLTYQPSDFLYFAEELSDRAVPFLLFNLMIRGMNAVVVHGDTLSRKAKGVFLVENDDNDFLSFSSLNLFPRNETVAKEFNIAQWSDDTYPQHIESPVFTGIASRFGIEVRDAA